jgi:hypothetical protein
MEQSPYDLKQQVGHDNHVQSGFHITTVGHAASNLALGTNKLSVYPIEHVGYLDSEINDDVTTHTVEGTDGAGNSYSVAMNVSNAIRATWLPLQSNRLSPPNVRRGERVLLWQYGDSDEYYWTTTGLDDCLRRLETVIHAYSDTQDESVKVLTPDNSYWLEVSTHKKNITLSTCKADGEPFAYTIQVNTKDGAFVIVDDTGNLFELDSENEQFTLKTASGGILKLTGEDFDLLVKSVNIQTDQYTVNAKKSQINSDTAFTGGLTSNGRNISDSHGHKNVTRGNSTTGSVV